MKETIIQFFMFNLIGIANTAVGFTTVFLFLFIGVDPMLSNFLGYFIGAICSYILNSKFTFKKYRTGRKEILGFFSVLFVAYILNAIVFAFALDYMNPYYAQIISGILYTVTSFIMMKLFVFTKDLKIEQYN